MLEDCSLALSSSTEDTDGAWQRQTVIGQFYKMDRLVVEGGQSVGFDCNLVSVEPIANSNGSGQRNEIRRDSTAKGARVSQARLFNSGGSALTYSPFSYD